MRDINEHFINALTMLFCFIYSLKHNDLSWMNRIRRAQFLRLRFFVLVKISFLVYLNRKL